MSTSGLDVFDKTLQTTHIWLDEITDEIGPDRRVAWKVLAAVLHALRDRLSVDLAAHLGAQLPLLVRGIYYDHFSPARQPSTLGTAADLTGAVAGTLSDIRPVSPDAAVAAAFRVLSRHISDGQISHVRQALPHGIRKLWDEAETY